MADSYEQLAALVKKAAARGGVIVMPSFAVGRAQDLLFAFRALKDRQAIPDVPIIVDTPMGQRATEIYARQLAAMDAGVAALVQRGINPFHCSKLHFIADRSESIKLNSIREAMVIISSSGMLTGGRVLHHLKNRIWEEKNMVIFVGFQPEGSKGRQLIEGARSVRLMGEETTVRAEIQDLKGFSGHADRGELLRWCRAIPNAPERVAVVHGEAAAAKVFRQTLESELKWNAWCPQYREVYSIKA
jgi:metallo-beta-lactamase family protein